MDPVEKLLAIEEIKNLMARRTRCVDEKDWDGMAACYATDAISYSVQSEGLQGAQAIADRIKGFLEHRTTVHQVHVPEIEITSEVTATGIWPLEDDITWVEDGIRHWQHGYARYQQTYEKIDGKWLIKTHRLKYIKFDTSQSALT